MRQEVKGDTPAADELAYLSSIEREGDPKIFSVAPCDDAGVWGPPSSSLEANRHYCDELYFSFKLFIGCSLFDKCCLSSTTYK